MLQFFIKGGPVMIPLALCSITALALIIERMFFYGRARRWEERELKLVKLFLAQGNLSNAKTITAGWNSSLGRLTGVALKQLEHDPRMLENAVETAGMDELKRYERGLNLLDTIVTASPLLGLLGTVTGIIRAFAALSASGGGNATQLSLGIAEALYTTAFGLAIAIPTLFFLNAFYNAVEKQARRLNDYSREVLSILRGNAGVKDDV